VLVFPYRRVTPIPEAAIAGKIRNAKFYATEQIVHVYFIPSTSVRVIAISGERLLSGMFLTYWLPCTTEIMVGICCILR
jgi:hypothetical protein